MAKCKLCGKEVDKNTAFKLSARTYCCSEDELNKHNELENLVKIGRESLLSLFNSKFTTGNIILFNTAVKEIITKHREERFMLLADKCKKELKDNKLFNELDQSNKVKYLIAVMNNKIESIKSVVKTIEVCYNDIDEIKQIIPNNKTNISFMFDKYGE